MSSAWATTPTSCTSLSTASCRRCPGGRPRPSPACASAALSVGGCSHALCAVRTCQRQGRAPARHMSRRGLPYRAVRAHKERSSGAQALQRGCTSSERTRRSAGRERRLTPADAPKAGLRPAHLSRAGARPAALGAQELGPGAAGDHADVRLQVDQHTSVHGGQCAARPPLAAARPPMRWPAYPACGGQAPHALACPHGLASCSCCGKL